MLLDDAIYNLALERLIPKDLKIADRIIKTIRNELDVELTNYIGGGDMGYAWLLPHGFVFKLTTDKEEAFAASRLIKKHHPNVATYYAVYQIDNLDLFIIIQEYGGKSITDPELKRYLDTLPGDAALTIKSLKERYKATRSEAYAQLLSGMQFIRDENIDFYDLHSGNVVQKGGNLKIIDVGAGNVEPQHLREIELLESKIHWALSVNIISLTN